MIPVTVSADHHNVLVLRKKKKNESKHIVSLHAILVAYDFVPLSLSSRPTMYPL